MKTYLKVFPIFFFNKCQANLGKMFKSLSTRQLKGLTTTNKTLKAKWNANTRKAQANSATVQIKNPPKKMNNNFSFRTEKVPDSFCVSNIIY